MTGPLFVGLMSGTSLDGIDAALLEITEDQPPRILASHDYTWPRWLRDDLQALALGELDDIDSLGRLDNACADEFAFATGALLSQAGCRPDQITAIGSHGQTVRHRPDGDFPFTLQIGNPWRIAARTGIDVVADFRRADIAAGGQGAPLAPAFHAAVFRDQKEDRAVLNLGGIANITCLPADAAAEVTGFDTGPANRLLDDWCRLHGRGPFDRDGQFAASGTVSNALLERLLDDDYFRRQPPKSTGSEYFNLDWLRPRLTGFESLSAADVQATLVKLSAESAVSALLQQMPDCGRLLVCGGGVHNPQLMLRLNEAAAFCKVRSCDTLGIDPDYVEAATFAWLAHRRLAEQPGNLPSVTGARHDCLLGAVFQP